MKRLFKFLAPKEVKLEKIDYTKSEWVKAINGVGRNKSVTREEFIELANLVLFPKEVYQEFIAPLPSMIEGVHPDNIYYRDLCFAKDNDMIDQLTLGIPATYKYIMSYILRAQSMGVSTSKNESTLDLCFGKMDRPDCISMYKGEDTSLKAGEVLDLIYIGWCMLKVDK